jgi:hypothetical protein
LQLDDDYAEAIAEIVQESLRDAGDELAEAVRDQLRQELTTFRDTVDQFSIDIQWAVRQVRSAASEHRAVSENSMADPAPIHDTTPSTDPKPTPKPASSNVAAATRQSFLWQSE